MRHGQRRQPPDGDDCDSQDEALAEQESVLESLGGEDPTASPESAGSVGASSGGGEAAASGSVQAVLDFGVARS